MADQRMPCKHARNILAPLTLYLLISRVVKWGMKFLAEIQIAEVIVSQIV